jgi:lipoate synthase
LAIDGRPFEQDRVIPLGVSSNYEQTFIIKAQQVHRTQGGTLYLRDKMLNQYVALQEGSEYRFQITKDKASQGNSRFELSMKPSTEAIATMGLRYATITGVTRDDLEDQGAWLYAETIRKVHELNPGTGVEMLAPDFGALPELLNQVFETRHEVFAHNLETVPRIFKRIRPAFTYEKSLNVITQAREFGLITKSNLILGLGEDTSEIIQALEDLHNAGCDLITITQYLRPTNKHHPVERWVKPDEFVELAKRAEDIGFSGVMSGPLVRSSYRAGRLYKQALEKRAQVAAKNHG